jgi:BTB/POZ domain
MDLGVFQPFLSEDKSTGDDNAATNMKWRLPPEESFSDWTVEILVTPEDSHPTTAAENNPKEIDSVSEPERKERKTGTAYHVHKAYLGAGPRSSLYFAKVFRSQFSETSSQKSTVSLPPKAAECFPDLLDFIYSETSSNVTVDSPASAAAIRYLANYFGMEALFNNVNATFIGSNISNGTAIDYVHESIRYGDESLGKAASHHLVNSISNGSLRWTEAMATPPVSSLLEIAGTANTNQNLGRIIINYINSDVHHVTCENVTILLDKLCPQFVDSCPYDILQVVERYQLPADYPARKECASAIEKTLFDQPDLRGSASAGDGRRKAVVPKFQYFARRAQMASIRNRR